MANTRVAKRVRTVDPSAVQVAVFGSPPVCEVAALLYKSGDYSDLEVRCKDVSLKVHKNILCIQSQWFAKAVAEQRFLEGTTNVIMINEENPESVSAMVQYLYIGDYSLITADGATKGEEMLVHLDVYALADMMLHDGLKQTVEFKLEDLVTKNYKDPALPEIAKKAYDVSPPGGNGKHLRAIIVRTIVAHTNEMYQQHSSLHSTIAECAALSADLAIALMQVAPVTMNTTSFRKFTAEKKLYCSQCHTYSYSQGDTVNFYCPTASCLTSSENLFLPSRMLLTHRESLPIRRLFRCQVGHLFEREAETAGSCLYCHLPAAKVP